MTVTRDSIVDTLVGKFNLQRREAIDFLDTLIDSIKADVAEGKRVKLTGFGSLFLNKQYYHRKRRDIPVDEETPRWQTPSFAPSAKLKARIQRATVEISRDVD